MRMRLSHDALSDKARAIRGDILTMLNRAGSGHSGGSLSCVDILTVLYHNVLRHDPQNPRHAERDRFVLSKGHVCPALYAVLADCGYFDRGELWTLRQLDSSLQGHPYMGKTPGLDISSGSLGQGLSVAAGMALAARLDGRGVRVYCLTGDGELQEGQIWEAAMAAGQYQLSNLCAVVDYNGLQIDGDVEAVMGLAPLADKWAAFNWNVISVDGHCVAALEDAFAQAQRCTDRPTVLIAKTVKGKGVSFMENNAAWHGACPNDAQMEAALRELGLEGVSLC